MEKLFEFWKDKGDGKWDGGNKRYSVRCILAVCVEQELCLTRCYAHHVVSTCKMADKKVTVFCLQKVWRHGKEFQGITQNTV